MKGIPYSNCEHWCTEFSKSQGKVRDFANLPKTLLLLPISNLIKWVHQKLVSFQNKSVILALHHSSQYHWPYRSILLGMPADQMCILFFFFFGGQSASLLMGVFIVKLKVLFNNEYMTVRVIQTQIGWRFNYYIKIRFLANFFLITEILPYNHVPEYHWINFLTKP